MYVIGNVLRNLILDANMTIVLSFLNRHNLYMSQYNSRMFNHQKRIGLFSSKYIKNLGVPMGQVYQTLAIHTAIIFNGTLFGTVD